MLVSLIPINYRDTNIHKIQIDSDTINSALVECFITCLDSDYCLPEHHIERIGNLFIFEDNPITSILIDRTKSQIHNRFIPDNKCIRIELVHQSNIKSVQKFPRKLS